MKNVRGSVLLRVLLSIGAIFFIFNSIFFYINNLNFTMQLILLISFVIQFFLGIIILLIKTEKKAYEFFIALLFIGCSIMNWLVIFVLPVGINVIWPVYLIMYSIFLVISGIRKYKRIKFGFIIPSLSLFLMGIFFSLFSFGLVKLPFKTVAMVLGPVAIVILCGSLMLFFLIQQRHKELVIIDDDSGDFDDEELSFPKID